MVDGRTRALGRAALFDPVARVEALRAALRGGALAPERLALAAAAGDAAAAEALGRRIQPEPLLREWLWNFLPFGREAVLRALLASAQALLDHLEAPLPVLLDAQAALDQVPLPGDGRFPGPAGGAAPAEGEGQAPLRSAEAAVGLLRMAFEALRSDDAEATSILLALERTARAAQVAVRAAPPASDKEFLHAAALALDALVGELGSYEVRSVAGEALRDWALGAFCA